MGVREQTESFSCEMSEVDVAHGDVELADKPATTSSTKRGSGSFKMTGVDIPDAATQVSPKSADHGTVVVQTPRTSAGASKEERKEQKKNFIEDARVRAPHDAAVVATSSHPEWVPFAVPGD